MKKQAKRNKFHIFNDKINRTETFAKAFQLIII